MIGKVRRTRLITRGSEMFAKRNQQISLVFVATEDTYASKQYFEALQERGLIDRSRVEVITLPTTDGRSSLRTFIKSVALNICRRHVRSAARYRRAKERYASQAPDRVSAPLRMPPDR